MIRGIGTDIVAIARIDAIMKKYGLRFLKRHFSPRELASLENKPNRIESIAGRFAAKEAIVKALGTGFRENITMKDIEITNDELGKPSVTLSEKLQAQFKEKLDIVVSISHEHTYAVAFALWQSESKGIE
jgi:holo-[acyl-carrier protein] synthase